MRLALLLLLVAGCDAEPQPMSTVVPTEEPPAVPYEPKVDVEAVLDRWHAAAAAADFDAYFGAMTLDAVFIGTDATERWDRPAFEAFARPRFATGEGWTYTPIERHLDLRGDVAWFDERLSHARYGEVRGSGVLVRTHKGWQVRQYVLSFPIPNALAADVVTQIQGLSDAP